MYITNQQSPPHLSVGGLCSDHSSGGTGRAGGAKRGSKLTRGRGGRRLLRFSTFLRAVKQTLLQKNSTRCSNLLLNSQPILFNANKCSRHRRRCLSWVFRAGGMSSLMPTKIKCPEPWLEANDACAFNSTKSLWRNGFRKLTVPESNPCHRILNITHNHYTTVPCQPISITLKHAIYDTGS